MKTTFYLLFLSTLMACTSSPKKSERGRTATAAPPKDVCVSEFDGVIEAIGLTMAIASPTRDTVRFAFADSTSAIAINEQGWHFNFNGSDTSYVASVSESEMTIMVETQLKGRTLNKQVLLSSKQPYRYRDNRLTNAARAFELRQILTCPDLFPFTKPDAPLPVGYIARTVQINRSQVNDSLGMLQARQCGPGNSIIVRAIIGERVGFVHFTCAGEKE